MVRHKNRYFVIKIEEQNRENDSSLVLKGGSLHKAILERLQQLHGDFGVAATKSGFTAKYCNEKTRIAIVRVRHGPHRLLGSTLPLVNIIEKKNVILTTLYTGATIRQCFRFLMKYQKMKLDELCAFVKTDEEKLALKGTLMNFDKVLEIT